MSKNTAKKVSGKKVNLPDNDNKLSDRKDNNYLFCMSHASSLDSNTHWFQMLPIAFSTAIIIMITHMANYSRPMSQFFWSGDSDQLTDFFSYSKLIALLICAVLLLVILSYRIMTQTLLIKRSFAYIPIVIYTIFVLISYAFSDYKTFSLLGWNDRFEGTLSLISYMVILFYAINTINSERNIKWVVYACAFSSILLGILGISQATGNDFFQTDIGKKLITPSWFWDQVDSLNFTFQNNEIYQTVYNINYVSFYLTLLIPLFGLLFIKSMENGKNTPIRNKIFWGILFAILIFNLIGSASSGGFLGMAAVIIIGLIVLNKRILDWKKPIFVLILIIVIISGITYSRWLPEITNSIKGVLGVSNSQVSSDADSTMRHKIDYIITSGQAIVTSIEGNQLTIQSFYDDPAAIRITDNDGKLLSIVPTNISPIYQIDDDRFRSVTVRTAVDDNNNNYIVMNTDGYNWPFILAETGVKYRTELGKFIDLHKVPAIGWENNQSFGSGRGYIWSRTLPMLKNTILLGRGADTYCIYFPHEDYVGKYNSGTFSNNINIVVDKPHNLYFGAFWGTGGISVLALLALWGIYIVQSFWIYSKTRYDNDFIAYVGLGIFLGICGFLASAIVNDSSISVMPMFYGLLGTGISINIILKKRNLELV